VLAAPPAEPAKAAGGGDGIKVLVKGNNEFGCALYGRLGRAGENLFLSPYSISTALGMTYAGARGETEKQMAKVLCFELPQEKLHATFKGLAEGLKARAEAKKAYELSVANALWGQKGIALQKEFVELTQANYGAGLRDVDFAGATEASRQTINAWVEKETRDKIKELLKPGILTAQTRLVLTNAIYFKGQWETAFDKKETQEAPFTLAVPAAQEAPAPKMNVPLMHRKGTFGFWETDGLQVLELPYKGRDLSMVIILPTVPTTQEREMRHAWRLEAYAELEKTTTALQLGKWLEAMRQQEVEVCLPRFKVTSEFSLGEPLTSMGMTDAFSVEKADFSGMTRTEHLFISAVVHKAFVEVNEEGTEAAAATGVVLELKMAREPPPMFRADHPFVFLIREVKTGSILFMGRVMDPAK
jgi:serpin B